MPEDDGTRWDYNTTIKFIRLLHARPIIWKKNLKQFVDQAEKDAAISDIAERMNSTTLKIKNRIKRMKEQCYQEEIRMQTFNDHLPRWNYFHQFRFVLKAEYENECIKRETVEAAEEMEIHDMNEVLLMDDTHKRNKLFDESIEQSEFQLNSDKEITQTECHDEFTALGKSIANELRKLENNKASQTRLKNEITLAMLEAIENVAKQKAPKL